MIIAFNVTCITDVFRPSFDIPPFDMLIDPSTVKLAVFQLLVEQVTNK